MKAIRASVAVSYKKYSSLGVGREGDEKKEEVAHGKIFCRSNLPKSPKLISDSFITSLLT